MLIKSTNDTPEDEGAGTVWFTGDRRLTRRERSVFAGRLKDRPFWQILTTALVLTTLVFVLEVWVIFPAVSYSSLNKDVQSLLSVVMGFAAMVPVFLVFGSLATLPLRRKSAIKEVRRGDWQDRGFIHESRPMYRLVQPLMSDANLRDTAFVDRLNHFFTVSASIDYELRYSLVGHDEVEKYETFCRRLDELLQAARVVAGDDAHFQRDMQIWRAGMIKQANKELQRARSSAQARVLRLQSAIDTIQAKLPEQSEIRE